MSSEDRTPAAISSPTECERLAQAIASGDPQAEQEFVALYARPVRAMLLARSRDIDLTADLQQDVLIEAICALRRGQIKDPARLTAYVIGIVRNTLSSYYRANQRAQLTELPRDLPDLRPDAQLREEEERESLAAEAIAALDAVDRAILQMTLCEGMKPGAIAEKLRMKSDVVRQRKVRATRRVIEWINDRSQNAVSGYSGREKPQ